MAEDLDSGDGWRDLQMRLLYLLVRGCLPILVLSCLQSEQDSEELSGVATKKDKLIITENSLRVETKERLGKSIRVAIDSIGGLQFRPDGTNKPIEGAYAVSHQLGKGKSYQHGPLLLGGISFYYIKNRAGNKTERHYCTRQGLPGIKLMTKIMFKEDGEDCQQIPAGGAFNTYLGKQQVNWPGFVQRITQAHHYRHTQGNCTLDILVDDMETHVEGGYAKATEFLVENENLIAAVNNKITINVTSYGITTECADSAIDNKKIIRFYDKNNDANPLFTTQFAEDKAKPDSIGHSALYLTGDKDNKLTIVMVLGEHGKLKSLGDDGYPVSAKEGCQLTAGGTTITDPTDCQRVLSTLRE